MRVSVFDIFSLSRYGSLTASWLCLGCDCWSSYPAVCLWTSQNELSLDICITSFGSVDF